ncbi:RNA polymerase sigma factor SigJ [Amycolatopsis sp. WQ 127309]|uniref:RNA polymerase sigma factor SigJ n=1 Tax=Amycolatopsis sp. WQ 127309 TaxID=2932773 RepID=UPI001FF0F125|nr:RNA polymerase sigma factor SigJ [Amycolatopsis sp. WQ 127309]UOZ03835.1 RNA polymerase sigma factor SigJ [Amycolatopsis sp. WQ 127309]
MTRPDPITSERRHLTSLGYRLLGSLADAEDVVQETFARWYALSARERDAIASPGAWLTTVAGRICLTQLASARVRREAYVGDWIPEPLPGSTEWIDVDPADRVTLDESVDMAFLVVLEAMTPAERVAFVLHDVYRYPFAEVAGIVGRSAAACRQLASSARRRIQASRPPVATPTGKQADLVRSFKAAWEAQDIAALVGLLDPGVTATADGGGLATARLEPVYGGEAVARACVAILDVLPGMTFRETTVNGRPGLLSQQDGVTVTVFAFDVEGDRIKHIWAVRNPEKLRAWTAA